MLSLLYVHGTGVRTQEFEKTLASIKKHTMGGAPGFDVIGCNWGEEHGARQARLSIPERDQTKSVEQEEIPNSLSEPWAQLISDPLIEITLTARLAGKDDSLFCDRKTVTQCEAAAVAVLQSGHFNDEVRADVDPAQLLRIVDEVFRHEEVDRAWCYARDSEPNINDGIIVGASMLARAIVASWLVSRFEQGFPTISGGQRDVLVNILATAMSGTAGQKKGVLGDAFSLAMAPVRKLGVGALRITAQMGTFALRHYRAGLSDATTPRVGDILLYQARGDGIRQKIAQQIQAAQHPVVLLGHSLGGIACVDLLALAENERVVGLVTVGSQAPYLHEMGALSSVEPNAKLPCYFPPWLNFYDRSDLLSYVAEPVFGKRVVEDVEIKSNQPFPLSHSAYWTNAHLWERLRTFAEGLRQ
jgi:hypothetical protein